MKRSGWEHEKTSVDCLLLLMRGILIFIIFYVNIDPLPEGILSGPNVCEREEMREEVVRVMDQQLVPREETSWCWPKIRCSTTKMVNQPVEKLSKIVKPHRVKYCCDGFVQNFMGNRCLSVALVEGISQQKFQQTVVEWTWTLSQVSRYFLTFPDFSKMSRISSFSCFKRK